VKYEAPIIDRLVGALTYPTFCIVGIAWIIITHFGKMKMGDFAAFHIRQSIILGMILVVFSTLFGYIFTFLYKVPFIGAYIERLYIIFVKTPIYISPLNFSILHAIIFISICYLSLGALLGKLSYVPYISDVVKPGSDWRRK